MATVRLPLSLAAAALLLAACATSGPTPTGTAATPAATGTTEGARPSAPANDAESERRRELREMILAQVEPCLREELAGIEDPRAVGPMVVVFGFEPTGEAVTAQLSDDALARYEADESYREVANAIMTGVVACAPLENMPADEHEEWGMFPLVFGPLEA